MNASSDLFGQCVTAVANQVEAELERRGVTLETADQWEQITYAEDLMRDAGEVMYKVQFRMKDGSDWFQVEAALNNDGTCVDIAVTTPTTEKGGA